MIDTVEDYLAATPAAGRAHLDRIRRHLLAGVRAVAPDADVTEVISYRIPTVVVNGERLVHYAAWKSHVSLYPVPSGDADLDRELAPYVAGRGTLRIPLDRPLSDDLIQRVAQALLARRAR